MDEWLDAKIRATALWYIGKQTMDPQTWYYTTVGETHPEISARVELQPGELYVVSFFLSTNSWYTLTTRRVVGAFEGQEVAVSALSVCDANFGDFKTRGRVGLGIMTLRLDDGSSVRLQYETWKASMAPMYYFRYWAIKYPILDKLRAQPNSTVDQARISDS
jgi:hypothetical protein